MNQSSNLPFIQILLLTTNVSSCSKKYILNVFNNKRSRIAKKKSLFQVQNSDSRWNMISNDINMVIFCYIRRPFRYFHIFKIIKLYPCYLLMGWRQSACLVYYFVPLWPSFYGQTLTIYSQYICSLVMPICYVNEVKPSPAKYQV